MVLQREPSVSSQNRRPAPQTDFALFNCATFPSISVIACDRQMSAWPLSSFLFQGKLLEEILTQDGVDEKANARPPKNTCDSSGGEVRSRLACGGFSQPCRMRNLV